MISTKWGSPRRQSCTSTILTERRPRRVSSELAQKAGMEIVLNSAYPENITDASPLVSTIQQSGAQVLFPVSYITDASLILTGLRSANSHVLVIGGGAEFIWPPIGKSLGDKVNGLISVASWNLNSKNVKDKSELSGVTERYQKAHGTFMPEQAGEAYAGISVLAAAIEFGRFRRSGQGSRCAWPNCT